MTLWQRLRVRLYYLIGYAEGRYGWMRALSGRRGDDD